MAKTSDKIMDLAQDYIQTRGYNAFSYKDLANDLGIKTASIHYHFPKKADLGAAIVQRYTETFMALYGGQEPTGDNHLEQFQTYLGPFIETSNSGVRICLCGALGGEVGSLPDAIQTEVVRFIEYHEHWLSRLLDAGRSAGSFKFPGNADDMARVIFSTLQGALTISRAKNNSAHFENAVTAVQTSIGV